MRRWMEKCIGPVFLFNSDNFQATENMLVLWVSQLVLNAALALATEPKKSVPVFRGVCAVLKPFAYLLRLHATAFVWFGMSRI